MAAANPLQSLKDETICSICQEFYTDPVTTECGHNFCRPCISEYLQVAEPTGPCPECRATCSQETLRFNRKLQNVVEQVTLLSLWPETPGRQSLSEEQRELQNTVEQLRPLPVPLETPSAQHLFANELRELQNIIEPARQLPVLSETPSGQNLSEEQREPPTTVEQLRPLPVPPERPKGPSLSEEQRELPDNFPEKEKRSPSAKKKPWDPTPAEDSSTGYPGTEQPFDDYLLLQQEQLQRSIHASQQMLFDGLAVSIGMIEELERLQHEDDGRMKRSLYPTMGHTPLHAQNVPEALNRIEGSLAMLGLQLKATPLDASVQAKTKMLEAVLQWLGTRSMHRKGITEVDHYAVNILELLFLGDITIHRQMRQARMHHAEKLDEQMISNVLSWISIGRAYSEQGDQEFEETPERAAVLSNLRNEGSSHDGIMRAVMLNPALEQILEKFEFTERSQL